MLKFFTKKKKGPSLPEIVPKPRHVAVIMDGNGRWANARGLSRVAGHKKGVDSVKSVVKSCLQHKIEYLSIFAFSSENWKRPGNEVDALMELLTTALESQTKKLNENGIRLKLIGDLSKFSEKIQSLAHKAEHETSLNNTLTLIVAINYGGRWDITQACQQIAGKVKDEKLSPEDINEDMLSEYLSTYPAPDPDLYIRTSGEYRISNFLLWQAAYSEFYFVDEYWPDFDEHAFTNALLKYTSRDRRFGGAKDKLESKESSDKASDISAQASYINEAKATQSNCDVRNNPKQGQA